jgi:hypothetical protein
MQTLHVEAESLTFTANCDMFFQSPHSTSDLGFTGDPVEPLDGTLLEPCTFLAPVGIHLRIELEQVQPTGLWTSATVDQRCHMKDQLFLRQRRGCYGLAFGKA